MKKFIPVVAIMFFLGFVVFASPAMAGDTVLGQQIKDSGNSSINNSGNINGGVHANGGNVGNISAGNLTNVGNTEFHYGAVQGGSVKDSLNNNLNGNLNGNLNHSGNSFNVNNNVNKIEEGAVKNFNVNKQGQLQGQLQGQAQKQKQGQSQEANNTQAQSQDAHNSQSQSANNEGNNQSVSMDTPRDFMIAPGVSYPGMPSYYGNATQNANVQSVKFIIMYKSTFTRGELCEMLGQKVAEGKDASDAITIVIAPPAREAVAQRGLVTMKAKNTETGTKFVLFKAALSAMNMGGNVFFITAEGAGTKLHSFGWGIGLAYSHATMNTAGDASGVASGGMGVSGGTAGYGSLPWVQGIALHTK